jgi:hypothetical protein
MVALHIGTNRVLPVTPSTKPSKPRWDTRRCRRNQLDWAERNHAPCHFDHHWRFFTLLHPALLKTKYLLILSSSVLLDIANNRHPSVQPVNVDETALVLRSGSCVGHATPRLESI